MSYYAHVKDEPTLQRDLRTGALVSSPTELEAYRVKRAKLLIERDKDREFNVMKNEIKDIKNLLQELLSKLS